jgi:predicted nucleotidyltransferase
MSIGKTPQQIIIDYAFENKDNAEIALQIIYRCQNEIRKKIIINFLNALEEALRDVFPKSEWRVENSLRENVLGRYRGVYFAKGQDGETYKIGFYPDQDGPKAFIIGIVKPPQAQPIPNLKAAVDASYRPGQANAEWEWYRGIDDGYGDWNNEETLMRLYRQDEAIKYFRDHLARLKEIASPFIDGAVRHAELVRRIIGVAKPLRIRLFGSAARGDMRRDSDLDVLVVMPEGTHRRQTAQALHEQMAGFPVPVDILVTTPAVLEQHKDDLGLVYRRILREGRDIYVASSA